MNAAHPLFRTRSRGFTLLELALALAIIAMVLGATMVPLRAQVDQRNAEQTQRRLNDVNEALLGFAIKHGRLPCPATANSNGVENPVGGTAACADPFRGFVPAATLGLPFTDAQGFALDAWGARIRYAVTTANTNAFTTTNGMRVTRMPMLAPDLSVCPTSIGIRATDCGINAPYLTNAAVAAVYSLGSNWATGGTSADEAANLDANPVFVSRTRADAGSARGEFDDIVTWLSSAVLFSRMVAAGQLP